MIRFSFLLLCILNAICALKVMNFNMFRGHGINDQINKTVVQIKDLNPDIIAVAEINEEYMQSILGLLGNGWSGIVHCNNKHEVGILTRHRFVGHTETVDAGVNARIRLNNTGLEVSFWSMYFHWSKYAPFDEAVKGTAATTVEKILACEKTRIQQTIEVLKNPAFVQQIQNSDYLPVIVAGMFNTPSHLDWTEATKNNHYGFVVDWPVTKILTNAAGMADAFREVHPDPYSNAGNTWSVYSTWLGKNITKDRIDFNFYRGSLRPTSSYTYSGKTPVADTNNWRNNEWPSDHFALITEFEETPRKFENKPSFHIGQEYLTGSYPATEKCTAKIIH